MWQSTGYLQAQFAFCTAPCLDCSMTPSQSTSLLSAASAQTLQQQVQAVVFFVVSVSVSIFAAAAATVLCPVMEMSRT
jgi:hypothetical protein